MEGKFSPIFMEIRFGEDGFSYHIGNGFKSDGDVHLIENGYCKDLNQLIQRIMAAQNTSRINKNTPKVLGINVRDEVRMKDVFKV